MGTKLEEIKEQLSQEEGYSSWGNLCYYSNTESAIVEVARRYATECVKASLEKASYNVELERDGIGEWGVDKQSITSPDNIVLL